MADNEFHVGQRVLLKRMIQKSKGKSAPPGEYVIFKIRRGFLWMSRRYRIKSIPDEHIDTTVKHDQLVESIGEN